MNAPSRRTSCGRSRNGQAPILSGSHLVPVGKSPSTVSAHAVLTVFLAATTLDEASAFGGRQLARRLTTTCQVTTTRRLRRPAFGRVQCPVTEPPSRQVTRASGDSKARACDALAGQAPFGTEVAELVFAHLRRRGSPISNPKDRIRPNVTGDVHAAIG